MSKKTKKTTCYYLLSAFLIVGGAFLISVLEKRFMPFDRFTRSVIREHLEKDFMAAHFLTENPTAFCYTMPTPRLPGKEEVSVASYEKAKEYYETKLEKLCSYDYTSLNDRQKRDFEILKRYFEIEIALNSYPECDYPWYPTTGRFETMITNFTEFPIRNEKDVQNYLRCMETVPEYIGGLIELTKWQIQQGCFPEASIVREGTANMRAFHKQNVEQLSIYTSFIERLDALDLDAEKKEQYIQQHKDLLENTVKPSVKECYLFLESNINVKDPVVTDRAKQKEYYEAYIRSLTWSDESLDDLKYYFDRNLRSIVKEMNEMDPDGDYRNEQIEISSPEALLEELRKNMTDYPDIGEIPYTVTETGKKASTVMAYYVIPAVDAKDDNKIKVNDFPKGESVIEYIIFAHEGFPGHCYQQSFYKKTEDLSYVPMIFEEPSYTEGWAQYAELDMLKHSGLSEEAVRYWSLKERFEYEMSAFTDIAVNGLGWTWEELDAYIKDIGYSEPEGKTILAKKLVMSAKNSPGLFVPYGYGMQKFLDLRNESEKSAGFDIVEFHRIILQYGCRPFTTIMKDLKQQLP